MLPNIFPFLMASLLPLHYDYYGLKYPLARQNNLYQNQMSNQVIKEENSQITYTNIAVNHKDQILAKVEERSLEYTLFSQINKNKITYSKKSSLKVNSKVGCSCQKSGCVKQFCKCLKKGLICTDSCVCVGCKNDSLDFITTKKSQRIQIVTCNCKKTQCSSKYCDCLASNKKCGVYCRCLDCQNKERMKIKREQIG